MRGTIVDGAQCDAPRFGHDRAKPYENYRNVGVAFAQRKLHPTYSYACNITIFPLHPSLMPCKGFLYLTSDFLNTVSEALETR